MPFWIGFSYVVGAIMLLSLAMVIKETLQTEFRRGERWGAVLMLLAFFAILAWGALNGVQSSEPPHRDGF